MSKWNTFVDIHSMYTYISEIRVGDVGNSLAVLWLGLCTLIAEVLGSIPGQGTKTIQAVQCAPLTAPHKKILLIKKKSVPNIF